MKAAPFDYFAPEDVSGALSLLAAHEEDAAVLAGGQSLIPAMADRSLTPGVVVDLIAVPELDRLGLQDGALALGPMVRQRSIERDARVVDGWPLIAKAAALTAGVAVRSRGTVGGSLAQADSWAEIPAALLTLDAEVTLTSERGAREIPVADLVAGERRSDELLSEIRIPRPAAGTGSAYEEVRLRKVGRPIAGVAVTLEVDDGIISRACIAVAGVENVARRADETERFLTGRKPTAESFDGASETLVPTLDPDDDLHASAAYRRHVAGVLLRRALRSASAEV